MIEYVCHFRYIGPNNNYITTKTIVSAWGYTDAVNNVKSLYPTANIISMDVLK